MIEANRSTLMEKIFFNHAIKNMSKRKERDIDIVHCHLSNLKLLNTRTGRVKKDNSNRKAYITIKNI